MALKQLLKENGILQREVAAAVGLSEAGMSRIVGEESLPRKATLEAILAYLSQRLGRQVTYEETFAAEPPAPDVVAPAAEASR